MRGDDGSSRRKAGGGREIYRRKDRGCLLYTSDYPLITIEEAEEKLLTGEYNSISGNTSIDKEDVEKVELCYSTGIEDYLIPYYQFYVNEPYEGLKEGVKHYKICLVPAIEDRYISERDMS